MLEQKSRDISGPVTKLTAVRIGTKYAPLFKEYRTINAPPERNRTILSPSPK